VAGILDLQRIIKTAAGAQLEAAAAEADADAA
jgi:hypothetical protein